MNYSEAIKAQKSDLNEARWQRTQRIKACKADLKAAEKELEEARKAIEEAHGKGSVLAEFGGATLHYDRIESAEWTIPLTGDVKASFSVGGAIAYGSPFGETYVREKGARTGRVNNRIVFITVTSPERQVTIEKKLGAPEHHAEEEAAARRFVDAVYNASKHAGELAKERKDTLAALDSVLRTAEQEADKARAALATAEADTVTIQAASKELERLQKEAQANGFDAFGRTAAQRRLAWLKRATAVAATAVAAMIVYLFFQTNG